MFARWLAPISSPGARAGVAELVEMANQRQYPLGRRIGTGSAAKQHRDFLDSPGARRLKSGQARKSRGVWRGCSIKWPRSNRSASATSPAWSAAVACSIASLDLAAAGGNCGADRNISRARAGPPRPDRHYLGARAFCCSSTLAVQHAEPGQQRENQVGYNNELLTLQPS